MLGAVKFLWKYRKPLGEAEKLVNEVKSMSMNLSFAQALKSKTIWTTLITGAINILPMVHDAIPAGALPIVNASLTLLAVIFRINNSAQTK